VKPKAIILAMLPVCGYFYPRPAVHPAQYAQGQCALIALGNTMTRQQFVAMTPMAQHRCITESDHFYALFPVSTRVYGEPHEYPHV
jgi:hypothetical protein